MGSPPTSMTRIATEANVPRKFLELILADLKGAQLLDSQRGKMGGYRLARAAHLISLGDIIRTIEGPLALVPCASRFAHETCKNCVEEKDCRTRALMLQVRDVTAGLLDGVRLSDPIELVPAAEGLEAPDDVQA